MIGTGPERGSAPPGRIALDEEPRAAATAIELDPDKNSLRFILLNLVVGTALRKKVSV